MGGASFFHDLPVGQALAGDDDLVAGAQGVALRALGDETVVVGLIDDLDRFFLQLRRRDDVDERLPVIVHMHGLERDAQAGVLAVDDVGRRLAHGQRVGSAALHANTTATLPLSSGSLLLITVAETVPV